MIKLHPSNVGKEIVTNGKRGRINWISASGEYFRLDLLEVDDTGMVFYDYRFEDIVSCDELVVMFKEPTWRRVSFNPVVL